MNSNSNHWYWLSISCRIRMTRRRYQNISDTFRDYKLLKKVVSITTDNASVNIKAIRELIAAHDLDQNNPMGFVLVRCSAHISQLSANNSLKLAKSSMPNMREFIKCIESSVKRADHFHPIQKSYIERFPAHNGLRASFLLLNGADGPAGASAQRDAWPEPSERCSSSARQRLGSEH